MCVTSFHLGSPFHFLLLVLALTAFYNFSCSLGCKGFRIEYIDFHCSLFEFLLLDFIGAKGS